MMLDPEELADEIEAEVMGAFGGDPEKVVPSVVRLHAEATARAVVRHFLARAQVTVQVQGACPTGAVTGTGSGTIK